MSDPPAATDATAGAKLGAPTMGARLAVGAASLLFLVIFAVCLVVPLVQTLMPIFPNMVAPLEERRQPLPFPSPRLLLQANGNFADGLNAWFDDRVGFRDLFIRTKNQIDYSLFRTSRKVYVGKDGWLFDRDAVDPLGQLTPAQMTAFEQSFVTLAEMLAHRGIRLVVVGHPDKVRVYPEMAPPNMPLPLPNDNVSKLRQFLASQPSLIFVDAEAILRKEKSRTSEHLFSKTDLHETEAGALSVVMEIIARIAQAEGRPEIHWQEDFKLAHEIWGPGNEGRFLAPLVSITESDSPYFIGRYTVGKEEPDGSWHVPDPKVLDGVDDGRARAFDFEFNSRPDLCPQRLPGMVLFGNSFSDPYWTLGLHRYFCASRRARNPMSRFKLFYDTIPEGTKYFIFQYYVPWLFSDGPPVDQLATRH